MSDEGDDPELVYRTRIVQNGEQWSDTAVNHFADPAEAKRWLEGFFEIRFDVEVSEWEESEKQTKWSAYPTGFDGRGVVMGCEVKQEAEPLLETLRETWAEVTGGAE